MHWMCISMVVSIIVCVCLCTPLRTLRSKTATIFLRMRYIVRECSASSIRSPFSCTHATRSIFNHMENKSFLCVCIYVYGSFPDLPADESSILMDFYSIDCARSEQAGQQNIHANENASALNTHINVKTTAICGLMSHHQRYPAKFMISISN